MAITTFLALVFVGYTIAHGGEIFILIIPLSILLIFVPPAIWFYKNPQAGLLKSILIFLPIAVLISLLIFIFFIRPSYERIIWTDALSSIEISNIKEEYIYGSDKIPYGLKITYNLQLPEKAAKTINATNPDEYKAASFFPIPFLRDEKSNKEAFLSSGLVVYKMSGREVNLFLLPMAAGTYKATVDFLPKGISYKEGKVCQSTLANNPHAQELMTYWNSHYLESSGPFKINFLARVSLSNRMGNFDYNFPDTVLNSSFSPSLVRTAIDKLLPCKE